MEQKQLNQIKNKPKFTQKELAAIVLGLNHLIRFYFVKEYHDNVVFVQNIIKKVKLLQELKLTNELLGIVNSKEEYEMLLKDKAELKNKLELMQK